jgi:hypothetical protein
MLNAERLTRHFCSVDSYSDFRREAPMLHAWRLCVSARRVVPHAAAAKPPLLQKAGFARLERLSSDVDIRQSVSKGIVRAAADGRILFRQLVVPAWRRCDDGAHVMDQGSRADDPCACARGAGATGAHGARTSPARAASRVYVPRHAAAAGETHQSSRILRWSSFTPVKSGWPSSSFRDIIAKAFEASHPAMTVYGPSGP